ncbi:hypothetical protein [Pilimelia columellifera]|uniref:hypothetical protein n=1 Tax=Pilimelia columellifera TaxID=706574 RepID=UPI003CD078A7
MARTLAGGPLAPAVEAFATVGANRPLSGMAPGLVVERPAEWVAATALIDGSHLTDLLDAAHRRWDASPHAAAALAWKAYTYWLALPAVLGWGVARRVPLLIPEDVLVHIDSHRPLVRVGLRPGFRTAVLPNDPLVTAGSDARIMVVPDEAALLTTLRHSLYDAHLAPLLGQIRGMVRLSARTLLGSLASGVAYGVIDAADALPGSVHEIADPLLRALGVADLVDINTGPDGTWNVQRRTCCLAFTLPEPKICSGCCLRPAP